MWHLYYVIYDESNHPIWKYCGILNIAPDHAHLAIVDMAWYAVSKSTVIKACIRLQETVRMAGRALLWVVDLVGCHRHGKTGQSAKPLWLKLAPGQPFVLWQLEHCPEYVILRSIPWVTRDTIRIAAVVIKDAPCHPLVEWQFEHWPEKWFAGAVPEWQATQSVYPPCWMLRHSIHFGYGNSNTARHNDSKEHFVHDMLHNQSVLNDWKKPQPSRS